MGRNLRGFATFFAAACTVMALSACTAEQPGKTQTTSSAPASQAASVANKLQTGVVDQNNLPALSAILKQAGLSNVDSFDKWVNTFLATPKDEKSDTSGFQDANCRMTTMLLAGNAIKAQDPAKSYEGTYLMFDLEAIDNQADFNILQDKRQLFTTLFGEMPIPASGFKDAFSNNLKKYDIQFSGAKFQVVNIVFKAFEEENAFVGHAAILIDTKDMENVDSDYLLVEKIAFNDNYMTTPVNTPNELLDILAQRPDYSVEEGDLNPLVYLDDQLVGELKM